MNSLDANGLRMTASSSSTVDSYNEALTALCYIRDPIPHLDNAIKEEGFFALGNIFKCYIDLLSTDRTDLETAKTRMKETKVDLERSTPINIREQLHIQILTNWLDGDMRTAGLLLDKLLRMYPHDMLALFVGHQIDFYLGDAQNLKNRIQQVLPKWDKTHPHYGFLLGMLAFGLEESGGYEEAEDVGRQSVERDGDDVWGIHAVAHALEMQGKFDQGSSFMESCKENWGMRNFFVPHNAIHTILFKLEQEDMASVIDLYDNYVFNDQSEPVVLRMIDASSALWRLHLQGVDTGNRWKFLADGWRPKAFQTLYTFNDMHAMMSFVGCGDDDAADQLIVTLEHYLQDDRNANETNFAITKRVGYPICKALQSFGRGHFVEVIERLVPIQSIAHEFGGSHAQRDVVSRTLLEACLLAGEKKLADKIISERLRERPRSMYNLGKQQELAAMSRPQ